MLAFYVYFEIYRFQFDPLLVYYGSLGHNFSIKHYM